MSRPLRRHQRVIDRLMQAIAAGETPVRDVLAAVTPGGGKSLLPVIAARRRGHAVPSAARRLSPERRQPEHPTTPP